MKILFKLSIIVFLFNSCGSDGNKFNLFDIEDDKKLGTELAKHIESGQAGMTVLDSAKYPIAYGHMYRIRNNILNSGQIKHKDDFEWRLRIIQNDTILNAFASPGGYIFVYTGLIKFLETEDQLAGVLGHEIAHADQRHSTQMLTKVYGIDFLLSIVLGNDYAAVREVGQSLLGLSFSRGAEEDADKHSVQYLCHSGKYQADGAAGFFKKMIAEHKDNNPPEFLSTHPNPPNRVERIEDLAKSLGCSAVVNNKSGYAELKKNLP